MKRYDGNECELKGRRVARHRAKLDGRTIARMQLSRLNEEAQRLGYSPILRYADR